MTTLLGLSGSLRQASYNSALLRAAAQQLPGGATLEIASIKDVPLYDGDFEAANGVPDAVTQLKDRIAAAQGLLIATPEYNQGVPGVLKNAIDWLSRPQSDISRVFGDKPVGIIGASPGLAGTRLAQVAWLPTFRMFGSRVWFGKTLHVGGASKVFGADGELVDPKVQEQLRAYLEGFVAFAAS